MSTTRALAALRLQPTDLVPWYEHIFHPALVQHFTGIDARQNPTDAWVKLFDQLDMDMIGIGQVPHPGRDFFEAMGNDTADQVRSARHAADVGFGMPSGTRSLAGQFQDLEQVFHYQPQNDTGPAAVNIVAAEYRPAVRLAEMHWQQQRTAHRCLTIPDLYTTLFMWPVVIFDWEYFLLAAAEDEARFDQLLDRFFAVSQNDIATWAAQNPPAILLHDDLCMSTGPMFHPDWYHRYIFPRYRQLFAPLKEKGTKIIFVSDGKADCFIDDLIVCGIDGFNWDYNVSFQSMLQRYAGKLCLIGGIDIRDLSSRSPQWVREETRRLLDLARNVPGFFMNVSGGIPDQVPLENAVAYIETVSEHR
jgi:hypothetical protein